MIRAGARIRHVYERAFALSSSIFGRSWRSRQKSRSRRGFDSWILELPANKKAYNKIYNFCGSEEISVRELAKLILELRHRKSLIVPIPVWVCKMIASTAGLLTTSPPLTWNGILGLTQSAKPDWSQTNVISATAPSVCGKGSGNASPARPRRVRSFVRILGSST